MEILALWRRVTRSVAGFTGTVWESATVQITRWRRWLRRRRQGVFWAAGVGIVALFIGFVIKGGASWHNAASWYNRHHDAISPLLTLSAGVAVAGVALARHFAQTNADRQRRITEGFSKTVEQLGSDKLEVRLGGIYSLERISKESPDDYWTVMENLTAFVRERSRRTEVERNSQDFDQRVSRRAYFMWQKAGRPDGRAEGFWADAVKQEEFGEPPATDIAAVLTVIKRRTERSRRRESTNNWFLDLSCAILKQADLTDAHLERANLEGAHLEWADLSSAHLEGGRLEGAHLEEAHLEGAHLEGARLRGAHLEGASLVEVVGLSEARLRDAHSDAATRLPPGVARPAGWPGSDAGTNPVPPEPDAV